MNAEAYVKGVLDGDGWIERQKARSPRLCLKVTSKAFALIFLTQLRGLGLNPHIYEYSQSSQMTGYSWTNLFHFVQATCSGKLVAELIGLKPNSLDSQLSYLIGFYHSEGSLTIKRYAERECWNWRIYNKDVEKLRFVLEILGNLGVHGSLRKYDYNVPWIDVQDKKVIAKLIQMGVTKAGFER